VDLVIKLPLDVGTGRSGTLQRLLPPLGRRTSDDFSLDPSHPPTTRTAFFVVLGVVVVLVVGMVVVLVVAIVVVLVVAIVVVIVVLGVVGLGVVFLIGVVLAAVVMSLGVGVIGVTLQSYSVAWSSHTSLGGLKFRLGGWHFMAMGSPCSLHLQ